MTTKTIVEKVWKTEAGFKAVVLIIRGKHRCGYVGVDKTHPLYMQDYNKNLACLMEVPEDEPMGDRSPLAVFIAAGREEHKSMDIVFDVHGGVTFADFMETPEHKFDPHIDPNGEELWYIGFDCAHYNDEEHLGRSLEYVVKHCESLARQIKDKTIIGEVK